MEMTKYAPGAFSWVDLATTDLPAATKFYTELLGIGAKDSGVPGYTLMQLKGKDTGALGELQKEQRDMGIPPHWNSYITVASADESVKKAESLGGKTILPAFDVMQLGRMAVIQDPTGAAFAIWQAKEHIGSSFVNEPGTFCWNELMTTNTDAAGAFYTKLFNWTTKVMAMPNMQYTIFENGGRPNGGMLQITKEMGPVPANWMVYFAVDDCDARAKKAEGLGAKVMVPPQDIPNTGRFSVLTDPQGAAFAIIKLIPM